MSTRRTDDAVSPAWPFGMAETVRISAESGLELAGGSWMVRPSAEMTPIDCIGEGSEVVCSRGGEYVAHLAPVLVRMRAPCFYLPPYPYFPQLTAAHRLG